MFGSRNSARGGNPESAGSTQGDRDGRAASSEENSWPAGRGAAPYGAVLASSSDGYEHPLWMQAEARQGKREKRPKTAATRAFSRENRSARGVLVCPQHGVHPGLIARPLGLEPARGLRDRREAKSPISGVPGNGPAGRSRAWPGRHWRLRPPRLPPAAIRRGPGFPPVRAVQTARRIRPSCPSPLPVSGRIKSRRIVYTNPPESQPAFDTQDPNAGAGK